MIRAIIFDCFGVLTTDKWKEFVGTLPDNIKRPAREINHTYDAGFISEEEFIAQIHKLTGRNPGGIEATHSSDNTKNIELLHYISELKPKYKIGLLSNVASDWIRKELLVKDEQTLFDDMVFSFEVGMTKPDPRIFQTACERLDVQPAEAVLVDDIERYCSAARDVGIQAIVYKDFAQMKRELEQVLAV